MTTILTGRNSLLRAGIQHLLANTEFMVVREFTDGTGDLSGFAEDHLGLIVISDSRSPEEYRDILCRIKAQCPLGKTVIVADHLSAQGVFVLKSQGLDGICPTDMSRQALLATFRLVMAGEFFLPAAMGLALCQIAEDQAAPRLDPSRAVSSGGLSERELQILQCLTQGASNKLIARHLSLAEATVKVHIKAILTKLRADNRTQAAIWAKRHLNIAVAPGSAQPASCRIPISSCVEQ